MADKRMFAKTIIDSDAFLEMPMSTQALYFHLCMRADDDGFLNNPKRIQRTIGASDDDLKLLIVKRFVLAFESGVIVIKHWRLHNYIRRDTYKETVHITEKSMLSIKENGSYTDHSVTLPSRNCDESVTQNRLDKIRLNKTKEEEIYVGDKAAPQANYDYDFYQSSFNSICSNLPKCKALTEKRKKAIREYEKQMGKDSFEEVCRAANSSPFCTGKNDRNWKADFDFLIRADKATSLLEGKYGSTGFSYQDSYEEGTSF